MQRRSVEYEVAVDLIQVPSFVCYTTPSLIGKDTFNIEDCIWVRVHE